MHYFWCKFLRSTTFLNKIFAKKKEKKVWILIVGNSELDRRVVLQYRNSVKFTL